MVIRELSIYVYQHLFTGRKCSGRKLYITLHFSLSQFIAAIFRLFYGCAYLLFLFDKTSHKDITVLSTGTLSATILCHWSVCLFVWQVTLMHCYYWLLFNIADGTTVTPYCVMDVTILYNYILMLWWVLCWLISKEKPQVEGTRYGHWFFVVVNNHTFVDACTDGTNWTQLKWTRFIHFADWIELNCQFVQSKPLHRPKNRGPTRWFFGPARPAFSQNFPGPAPLRPAKVQAWPSQARPCSEDSRKCAPRYLLRY